MLAVPHIVKTKGNIVNVSSVCGLRGFPGVLSYCMSKAAIDQFTKCIALELADKQVCIMCKIYRYNYKGYCLLQLMFSLEFYQFLYV